MSLSTQDIGRIAKLARLTFDEAQTAQMQSQLNGYFDIVTAMQAVDTEGITPLAHPIEAIQPVALRLREDKVAETNQREANQKSAPAVGEGLFLVPRVIE